MYHLYLQQYKEVKYSCIKIVKILRVLVPASHHRGRAVPQLRCNHLEGRQACTIPGRERHDRVMNACLRLNTSKHKLLPHTKSAIHFGIIGTINQQ